MNTKKKIYLIDGSAYIYRAYHAVRELSNSQGLPTNAVFGFTNMLIKLIKEKSPEYLMIFFDVKGPTFRHKMYGEYKANRPPMPEDLSIQIPHIKNIVSAFNLPSMEKQGYEADDLIGTVAKKAEDKGFSVIMVTGDKDFKQLVTKNIIIWDPMKDKVIDIDAIKAEFGLGPEKMIDIMGLMGDKADNIPGVPGIGPKTASSLITTFGTLEQLYENIDTVTKKKQRENLINFKTQAFLSKDLVTIKTDIPLLFDQNDFLFKGFDNEKLSSLFKELEFKRLEQALPRKTDYSKKNYHLVQDKNTFLNLLERLKRAKLICLDTETTSKNPMKAGLVGISISIKEDEAFYLPCGHDYSDAPPQMDIKELLNGLKPIFENPDIKKVGQNIKYDWIVLERHGATLEGVVFDTMLASYILNPSVRGHSLDQIAMNLLNHKMISYKEVIISDNGKKLSSFSKVPLEKAVVYACEDADITLMAYNRLFPMLEKEGLLELFEKVEMPLVPVLKEMETNGIKVDTAKLSDLSSFFALELESLETRIYEIAGEKFNIKSPMQLGKILFEKLNLPVQKKTKKKTGYSTDVDVLRKLAPMHELPEIVLKHRTFAKLKSTYTDALLGLADEKTDRVHTSFNQTITATGRLSSSDPNLQNIPIRGEEGKKIRSVFIPKKGSLLVVADYSQIELRILAHYSKDQILKQAFLNDEDIHTRTASEVFQVFPLFVDPDLRRQAKVINFGIVYGMSPYGLSKELNISHKMAKTYIDNYFKRYKGVKEYMDRTIKEAEKIKKSSTLLGRIRYLPDIDSPNKNMRELAGRTAINTPIQGTAADLLKLAMIRVNQAFKDMNLASAMLLSVHDEIVVETPEGEVDLVKDLVKTIMESVWELDVPLKVDVGSGANWAEAH
ncbi:MAG TPA: DNA polymerase I [Desulfobacteraceae bacterium]|nr:DNA polymerase I [Desulfobacteraceae bacterium]